MFVSGPLGDEKKCHVGGQENFIWSFSWFLSLQRNLVILDNTHNNCITLRTCNHNQNQKVYCQNKATYAMNDQNCQTASLVYMATLEKCIGLCKTNFKKRFASINCLWTKRKIAQLSRKSFRDQRSRRMKE